MRTAKLNRFEEALRHYCVKGGRICRFWPLALRRSKNVLEIRDRNLSTLVYVKDFSHEDGFWGLNEPQLNAIRQSRHGWHVVLLYGSSEDGFTLDSKQIEDAIAVNRWSVGGDDYKLHTTDLPEGTRRFSQFHDLFSKFLNI
jgi:hypothetical protein